MEWPRSARKRPETRVLTTVQSKFFAVDIDEVVVKVDDMVGEDIEEGHDPCPSRASTLYTGLALFMPSRSASKKIRIV